MNFSIQLGGRINKDIEINGSIGTKQVNAGFE